MHKSLLLIKKYFVINSLITPTTCIYLVSAINYENGSFDSLLLCFFSMLLHSITAGLFLIKYKKNSLPCNLPFTCCFFRFSSWTNALERITNNFLSIKKVFIEDTYVNMRGNTQMRELFLWLFNKTREIFFCLSFLSFLTAEYLIICYVCLSFFSFHSSSAFTSSGSSLYVSVAC